MGATLSGLAMAEVDAVHPLDITQDVVKRGIAQAYEGYNPNSPPSVVQRFTLIQPFHFGCLADKALLLLCAGLLDPPADNIEETVTVWVGVNRSKQPSYEELLGFDGQSVCMRGCELCAFFFLKYACVLGADVLAGDKARIIPVRLLVDIMHYVTNMWAAEWMDVVCMPVVSLVILDKVVKIMDSRGCSFPVALAFAQEESGVSVGFLGKLLCQWPARDRKTVVGPINDFLIRCIRYQNPSFPELPLRDTKVGRVGLSHDCFFNIALFFHKRMDVMPQYA